jgi:hypothetical protein
MTFDDMLLTVVDTMYKEAGKAPRLKAPRGVGRATLKNVGSHVDDVASGSAKPVVGAAEAANAAKTTSNALSAFDVKPTTTNIPHTFNIPKPVEIPKFKPTNEDVLKQLKMELDSLARDVDVAQKTFPSFRSTWMNSASKKGDKAAELLKQLRGTELDAEATKVYADAVSKIPTEVAAELRLVEAPKIGIKPNPPKVPEVAPDVKAPEVKAPEVKAPDVKVPDVQPPQNGPKQPKVKKTKFQRAGMPDNPLKAGDQTAVAPEQRNLFTRLSDAFERKKISEAKLRKAIEKYTGLSQQQIENIWRNPESRQQLLFNYKNKRGKRIALAGTAATTGVGAGTAIAANAMDHPSEYNIPDDVAQPQPEPVKSEPVVEEAAPVTAPAVPVTPTSDDSSTTTETSAPTTKPSETTGSGSTTNTGATTGTTTTTSGSKTTNGSNSNPAGGNNEASNANILGIGAGLAGATGLYALTGNIPYLRKRKLLRAITSVLGGAGIGYGAYKLAQPTKTASYKEFKQQLHRNDYNG